MKVPIYPVCSGEVPKMNQSRKEVESDLPVPSATSMRESLYPEGKNPTAA